MLSSVESSGNESQGSGPESRLSGVHPYPWLIDSLLFLFRFLDGPPHVLDKILFHVLALLGQDRFVLVPQVGGNVT